MERKYHGFPVTALCLLVRDSTSCHTGNHFLLSICMTLSKQEDPNNSCIAHANLKRAQS